MNDSLLPAVQSQGSVIVAQASTVTAPDIEVSAETPDEMRQAQTNLVGWCERKVSACRHEHTELSEAHDQAKKNKWNTKVLARLRAMALKKVEYYTKMLAALKEGYVLVPNFPIDIFAIRTDRKYPKRVVSFKHWENFRQEAQELPVGEGEYKNPDPVIYERSIPGEKDGKPVIMKEYYPEAFEEIDFPINMAKPHIMEATSYAMGLKIFDEIGILPSPKRKVDPVICGKIKLKTGPYRDRHVTFVIGWHIDTRTL